MKIEALRNVILSHVKCKTFERLEVTFIPYFLFFFLIKPKDHCNINAKKAEGTKKTPTILKK